MGQKNQEKDIWDKISAVSGLISGVVIVGIGVLLTHTYNNRALELNRIEVLDRSRPLLVSEKAEEREYAYSVFVALGYEDLAVRMISQNQDLAGKGVLTAISKTSGDKKTRTAAVNTLESLERVWVLDNSDPDYKNEPFDDTLTLLSNSGQATKVIHGLNICQTIGNNRPLAVSSNGSYGVVVENVNGQLSRYNVSGLKIWSMHLGENVQITAAAISEFGYVYAIATWIGGKGESTGYRILRLDAQNGNVLSEVVLNDITFDIVIDDKNYAIWLVGRDLKKLNVFLETQCISKPFRWFGVSVDFDSEGSVWVGEAKHPDIQDSKNRLVKFDSMCVLKKDIDLNTRPWAVRVDRNDDSFWALIAHKLHKFNKEGKLITSAEGTIDTITVNQRDGTVWAAGIGGIYRYDSTGQIILRNGGFSNDQKYVMIPSNFQ